MIPSFRILGDFPSFRLLGFGGIFHRSVIPRFHLLGFGVIFRRSVIPPFLLLGFGVISAVPSFLLLGSPGHTTLLSLLIERRDILLVSPIHLNGIEVTISFSFVLGQVLREIPR